MDRSGTHTTGSFFGFLLGFVGILTMSLGITVGLNLYEKARVDQASAAAQAILEQ